MGHAEKKSKPCCIPDRSEPQQSNEPSQQIPAPSATDHGKRVRIPGGQGVLGTHKRILSKDGEGPLRYTRLPSYLMDEAAVTNARFKTFVDDTGYVTDAERMGNSFVFIHLLPKDTATRGVAAAPWWREVEHASWQAPFGPGSEDAIEPEHPVVHVTWKDANAFAKWAGGRLPTESEWEHAARGGLGDVRFPWGDREPDDKSYFPCNIWQGQFPDLNLQADGYYATAPAISFEPNGYGLFNMVGNTWEYTSQPFSLKSLRKSVASAKAKKQGIKLTKGGSFLCHASYCYRYRIAARTGTTSDSSTSHQGFRLVYDMKE